MRLCRTLPLILLFSFLLQPLLTTPAHSESSPRPNIILILTDDLDVYPETLARLPNLQQLLIAEGMTFSSAIVTMPSCCPSRATVLTGKYVHNHKVIGNSPPYGGYPRFMEQGEEALTIGTIMAGAGYRTVLMGKYLNYYPLDTDPNHVPPGWTEWYAHARGGLYLTYVLNENGTLVKYPKRPENYSTDIYRNKAVDFITRNARDHAADPFFMLIAPYAPHYPVYPAPRHEALFGDVTAPRTAAYDEADVTDKPRWVAKLDPLTSEQELFIDDFYRNRLRAMQSVDEMLGAIYQALVDTDELANTYIIFTSDNGMHLGEHRIVYGKGTAYDVSVRVPFVVRGPGVPANVQQDAVISLVDLAPTFGAMAGLGEMPASFDGRSMLPLLAAPAPQPVATAWRSAVLFENPGNNDAEGDAIPLYEVADERMGPVTAAEGARWGDFFGAAAADYAFAHDNPLIVGKDGIARVGNAATMGKPETAGSMANVGFRTSTYKYVEYPNGDRELYDLVNDALEVENQAANASPALLTTLAAHLNVLRTCAGAACRTADAQMPPHVFPLTDDWPAPTVTPTGTATATATLVATATPTATMVITPTATVAATATALPTATATTVATLTAIPVTTPVPTATVTPVAILSTTPTATAETTPTSTATAIATPTPTVVDVEGSAPTPTPPYRQFIPYVGG